MPGCPAAFAVGSDSRVSLRVVETGTRQNGWVEVKSGLVEGEKVVENPRALLDDSSELKPGGKSRGPEGQPGKGQQDPGKGNPPKGGASPCPSASTISPTSVSSERMGSGLVLGSSWCANSLPSEQAV